MLTFLVVAQEESPHGESELKDCDDCHSAADWWTLADPLVFEHNNDTDFQLLGGHTTVDCNDCHTSLVFSEATLECASCHTDMHSSTVGRDCDRCHNEDSWLVDIIPELHEMNGFPLAGAHGAINCADCHMSEVNLRFDRVGNDCATCHMDDYSVTSSPNHVNVGFSLECMDCHDAFKDDWDAVASISHDSFPLVGGHAIGDCNKCHTGGNFNGTTPDCYGCHQDDYQTTNPNHLELDFSTNCIECHDVYSWGSGNFDHSNFPLVGAHVSVDCNDCHEGNYSSTPNTCYACHEDDYNSPSDPNHVLANFSIDCTECHDENSWETTFIQHDDLYFPIYSGKHKGEWGNKCSNCHTQASNYAFFDCINCHSNEAGLADEHDEENDYVFENNACFSCHPDGDD